MLNLHYSTKALYLTETNKTVKTVVDDEDNSKVNHKSVGSTNA